MAETLWSRGKPWGQGGNSPTTTFNIQAFEELYNWGRHGRGAVKRCEGASEKSNSKSDNDATDEYKIKVFGEYSIDKETSG